MLEQHERSRSQAKRRQKRTTGILFNKTGIIPKVGSSTLLTDRKSMEEEEEVGPRRGAIKMKWQLSSEESAQQQSTFSTKPKTPLFGNKNVKVSPKMTKRIQKELQEIEKEQDAKPLDLSEIFGKPEDQEKCQDIMELLLGTFNQLKSGIQGSPLKKEVEPRNKEESHNYQSFFGQQLALRPPDKISGTSAMSATLKPIAATKQYGSSFTTDAPVPRSSMLGTEYTTSQSTIKDLKLRVNCGIQSGDVSKQAHVVLCLALMLEEHQGAYIESARYYKRFYFCARLLQETEACALAINRLGVIYFKLNYFNRSLRYHLTHLQLSCQEDLFVSHYNIGVSLRGFKRYKKAVDRFLIALDFANRYKDLEQQCYANGQIGLTYLFMATERSASQSLPYLRKAIAGARKIRAYRALFQATLCLGVAHYVLKEVKEMEEQMQVAVQISKIFQCPSLTQKCLCNIGIAVGRLKAKLEEEMKAIRIKRVEKADGEVKDNLLKKHLARQFYPVEIKPQ